MKSSIKPYQPYKFENRLLPNTTSAYSLVNSKDSNTQEISTNINNPNNTKAYLSGITNPLTNSPTNPPTRLYTNLTDSRNIS